MSHFTIYHNPRCSKSREALALLQQHQIQPIIIEYLKHPLSLDEIIKLKSHFNLKDFVRYNEPIFKTLSLDLENEEQVLNAVSQEPVLMQRPIITYAEKAVIARPIERLLALIKEVKAV